MAGVGVCISSPSCPWSAAPGPVIPKLSPLSSTTSPQQARGQCRLGWRRPGPVGGRTPVGLPEPALSCAPAASPLCQGWGSHLVFLWGQADRRFWQRQSPRVTGTGGPRPRGGGGPALSNGVPPGAGTLPGEGLAPALAGLTACPGLLPAAQACLAPSTPCAVFPPRRSVSSPLPHCPPPS